MANSHSSIVSFAARQTCGLSGCLFIALLTCLFLPGRALSQAPPAGPVAAPPVVVDAFVLKDGKVGRVARLTDVVKVVVCKTDFNAWQQAQAAAHTPPSLTLYLNGNAMKGTSVNSSVPVDPTLNDPKLQEEASACANANASVKSLEDAAKASEAASNAAAQAAANVPDPKDPKHGQLQADAAKAAAAALSARTQAKAAADAADALVSLDFYLDPALASGADTKDSWTPVLRKPWAKESLLVSAGPATGAWQGIAPISLKRMNPVLLTIWFLLFAVAIGFFVRFAMKSDILRDTGALPAGAPAGACKAFSLSRVQLAMWTFIVAGSMAFIFLVTWNENTITNGVLVLIGISSGTTLLAAVADGTQPAPQVTQGFFTDLFTDGDGPTVHRYQMVLFTLILAIVFIVKVGLNLAMPEFDATLLGLMGISNGTYLGFKMQGK